MSVLDRHFVNNVSVAVSGSISSVAVSITVSNGALFNFVTGKHIIATIAEGGLIEVIKITNIVGNVLTVVRAQEGTIASSFTSAATISVRTTADTLNSIIWEIRELLGLNKDFGSLATLSAPVDTVIATEAGKWNIRFKADGTVLYFLNIDTTLEMVVVPLATAWDVSTFTTPSVVTLPAGAATNCSYYCFSLDGTKLYLANSTNLYQYNLSTAWNLASASYIGTFVVKDNITIDTDLNDIAIAPDGTFFIIKFSSGGSYSATEQALVRLPLSTAYSISSLQRTHSSLFIIPNGDGHTNYFCVSLDGTKILDNHRSLPDADQYQLRVYTLSTPYDLSTTSVTESLAFPLDLGGITLGDSDSKVYVYDFDNTTVKTYTW